MIYRSFLLMTLLTAVLAFLPLSATAQKPTPGTIHLVCQRDDDGSSFKVVAPITDSECTKFLRHADELMKNEMSNFPHLILTGDKCVTNSKEIFFSSFRQARSAQEEPYTQKDRQFRFHIDRVAGRIKLGNYQHIMNCTASDCRTVDSLNWQDDGQGACEIDSNPDTKPKF